MLVVLFEEGLVRVQTFEEEDMLRLHVFVVPKLFEFVWNILDLL